MSSPVLERAMTEDELLQAVGDALTLFGWRWSHHRRSDKGQHMGMPGLPDVVAVRRDRLVFAELKAEAGRLSPEQKAWMASLQEVSLRRVSLGGWALPETWLVKPSTLDVFLRNLR